MRKITFTKDYAIKKEGDVMEVDSMLASYLIHTKKVAKLYTPKRRKATKKED
jgi:hypothetical protein